MANGSIFSMKKKSVIFSFFVLLLNSNLNTEPIFADHRRGDVQYADVIMVPCLLVCKAIWCGTRIGGVRIFLMTSSWIWKKIQRLLHVVYWRALRRCTRSYICDTYVGHTGFPGTRRGGLYDGGDVLAWPMPHGTIMMWIYHHSGASHESLECILFI